MMVLDDIKRIYENISDKQGESTIEGADLRSGHLTGRGLWGLKKSWRFL